MQELSLPIQKALTQGLRPRDDIGRNAEFLTQCQYMKPLPFGLRPCIDCTNPFDEDYFDAWPFPQLIITASETLLAYENSIYSVTNNITYSTYSLEDPSIKKPITGTGIWHCVDLGEGWLLFNGTCVVFKLSTETMFGEDQVVYCQDAVSVQTGCANRGRLILGGFNPAQLFSGAWSEIWNKYLNNLSASVSTDFSGSDNFVYWSTIGGGDILLPFAPGFIKDGMIKEDKPDEHDEEFFLELFRRNELGWMPMPWQGSVLCVKPLGKGIAVYGTSGIAGLIPTVEPYPTYGLQRVADFGIFSRGAVGGDEQGHIFIDTSGNIWGLDASFTLRELGYKEYIASMVADEIVITKDAEYNEYHISGKDKSFVLTAKGLGQSPQIITGAYNTAGKFYGVFNIADNKEAIIATDIIDFAYRDLKTITIIEAGCSASNNVFVAVDYRYSKQGAWQRSPWVLTNPEGFARLQVTAIDFRVVVKCNSYENFELDYIKVRWQTSGRRTVRGVDAGTANFQSDSPSMA